MACRRTASAAATASDNSRRESPTSRPATMWCSMHGRQFAPMLAPIVASSLPRCSSMLHLRRRLRRAAATAMPAHLRTASPTSPLCLRRKPPGDHYPKTRERRAGREAFGVGLHRVPPYWSLTNETTERTQPIHPQQLSASARRPARRARRTKTRTRSAAQPAAARARCNRILTAPGESPKSLAISGQLNPCTSCRSSTAR
jgi:hypothetical protein